MEARKTIYLGDDELMNDVYSHIESRNISLSHFTKEAYRRFLKVEKLKQEAMENTPVDLSML